ncbi:hypothetical protein [Pseudooceanicola sp.]|uniref:hypothetical protein n=1 Tax=Pseudooceanicola sp. TaxID=1914328 RepID=UPI0035C6B0E4
MIFRSGHFRCEVFEVGGVFIGKVYEHDQLLCTLTADSLQDLSARFTEWIAG